MDKYKIKITLIKQIGFKDYEMDSIERTLDTKHNYVKGLLIDLYLLLDRSHNEYAHTLRQLLLNYEFCNQLEELSEKYTKQLQERRKRRYQNAET